MAVIWSPEAFAEASEYWRCIGEDDEAAADRWLATLMEKANLAAQFPRMGHSVPERRGHRQLIVHSHRLIYRIVNDGKDIEIVQVIHGARLLSDEDLEE